MAELDNTNFAATLGGFGNARWLVEFYSPNCGVCTNVAPEFEAAARTLADTPKARIAKVDAASASNEPLARQYFVHAYPKVMYFAPGNLNEPTDYDGAMTAAALSQFLLDKAGVSSGTLHAHRLHASMPPCLLGKLTRLRMKAVGA